MTASSFVGFHHSFCCRSTDCNCRCYDTGAIVTALYSLCHDMYERWVFPIEDAFHQILLVAGMGLTKVLDACVCRTPR